MQAILTKMVKNPMKPIILGIGFFGIGKYDSKTIINGINIYKVWSHILYRCYDKSSYENKNSYINCTVDIIWHNFQNFVEWYITHNIMGFAIDKDILFKGNKIYGQNTCCFVLQEINNLFTSCEKKRGNYPIGVCKMTRRETFISRCMINNVYTFLGYFLTPEEAFQIYKITKENEIKRIADKWKDKLSDNVYQSMYNYQVEITD
jgi:hypothetical protein